MAKCNKINVISFAKLQAILASLLGLVAGILYSFVGFVIDLLVSAELLSHITYATSGLSYGTVLAFGALVGMPLIFALVGFVLGLFEALFYNVYVKWFDAIEVHFWQ
jgi:hypothetical protein